MTQTEEEESLSTTLTISDSMEYSFVLYQLTLDQNLSGFLRISYRLAVRDAVR